MASHATSRFVSHSTRLHDSALSQQPLSPVPKPMSRPTLQCPGTSPAAMPPSRSKRAPHFSGSVVNFIEDFLEEYEEFANSCRLTDRQKVETVTRYKTPDLRDFWKSPDGHVASD
jgi:hypothetical protein